MGVLCREPLHSLKTSSAGTKETAKIWLHAVLCKHLVDLLRLLLLLGLARASVEEAKAARSLLLLLRLLLRLTLLLLLALLLLLLLCRCLLLLLLLSTLRRLLLSGLRLRLRPGLLLPYLRLGQSLGCARVLHSHDTVGVIHVAHVHASDALAPVHVWRWLIDKRVAHFFQSAREEEARILSHGD